MVVEEEGRKGGDDVMVGLKKSTLAQVNQSVCLVVCFPILCQFAHQESIHHHGGADFVPQACRLADDLRAPPNKWRTSRLSGQLHIGD